MMNKERRLGRGLEALLGRTARAGHGSPEPQPSATPPGEPIHPTDTAGQASGPVFDQPAFDQPVFGQSIGMNHDQPMTREYMPHLYQAPEVYEEVRDGVRDEVQKQTEVQEPFSELVSEPLLHTMPDATSDSELDVALVDVRLIEPNPFQPRRDFGQESLDSLSESITEHGLLQPLVVRRVDESYQLIAGERRFRAAQKSGMHEVPVRVVEADDRRMIELAIVENLQRKDLNALEKAASFRQYMESHGATQSELAGRLKIDRSTIANMIRLLELPDQVKAALVAERITPGHAKALLPLGEERLQIEFCHRIEAESLTVRDVERLVKEKIDHEDADPLSVVAFESHKKKTPTNDQLAALEQQFRMALGMKVKLTQAALGRGKLVINFTTHEEFERLQDIILAPTRPQEQAG